MKDKFKKGDLVKVQYPVAFENGEKLAKCTGVIISVEQTSTPIAFGLVGSHVVEVQWSNGTEQVRYYAESLMLIAAANPNV